MRKLMWFAIGFIAATAIWVYAPGTQPEIFWAAAGILFLISLLLRQKSILFRIAICISLGAILGTGYSVFQIQSQFFQLRQYDDLTLSCVIEVTDYTQQTDYGARGIGRVRLSGEEYAVRFYLKESEQIAPGAHLSGDFQFRVTLPDGSRESSFYQGQGIYLTLSQENEIWVSSERNNHRYPAVWTEQVRKILKQAMPEDCLPFSMALLLGDDSLIDYETSTALSVSGIRHLIAVSGLHVAILFGIIQFLVLRNRLLKCMVGIPVLFCFAAMAGFTPSVCRAAIMLALMHLADLMDREYDAPTELSAAVMIMVLINPYVIRSVSFQLSFASICGILVFQKSVERGLRSFFPKFKGRTWKGRAVRMFCACLSVTISAMAFTTPLSAYYFGLVSLAGILTNLLVIWAITPVFFLLIAVVAAGFLWMPAAVLLGGAAAILIRYILFVSFWISQIPYAAVYTCNPIYIWWLLSLYGMAMVLLSFRRRAVPVCAVGAAGGLVAAVLLSWYIPRQDDFRVTVLDVGQGQSILLQSRGQSVLVDCGGTSDSGAADQAASALLSQGVFQLDALILTHYDKDHAGGAANLLSRIPADHILCPVLSEKPEDIHVPTAEITEKRSILIGSGIITIYPVTLREDSAENNLAVLFEAENCGILITGDMGISMERRLLAEGLPQTQYLIAGHHGSKYATSEELLNALSPETVIISVGANNSYGHPSEEVLKRLHFLGCKILRTDKMGTIVIRR